jgi:hypothetical protein
MGSFTVSDRRGGGNGGWSDSRRAFAWHRFVALVVEPMFRRRQFGSRGTRS